MAAADTTSTKSDDKPFVHQKARTEAYQGAPEDKKRFIIKDEEVSWSVELATYQPVIYTTEKILADKPVWADPDVA